MDATEKKKEETARVERGVFVRNLDFTTTSSELETTFESVGPIKSCFVVTDPGTGKSRGYGIVQFAEADDAAEAVKTLSGKPIRGRSMQVELAIRRDPAKRKRKQAPEDGGVDEAGESAPTSSAASADVVPLSRADRGGRSADSDDDDDSDSGEGEGAGAAAEPGEKQAKKAKQDRRESGLDSRCVVLQNVPADVTVKMLYKRCKKIAAVMVGGVALGVSGPGTADVVFVGHKDARAAIPKLNGKTIKGGTLTAVLKTRLAATTRTTTPAVTGNTKRYRLIVRNLPFTCTEKMLRKACAKHGPLTEVTLVTDPKTSKPKGFAFVQYRKPTDAALALKNMNAKAIGGRTVAVDWALSKNTFEQNKDAAAQAAAPADDSDGSSDEGSDGESDDEDDTKNEDDDDEEDEDDEESDEGSDSEDEIEKSSDVQQGRTLFVRNVSFDTKDDALTEIFSQFGKIEMCKVVRDEDTGRSRGSAFVKFAERDQALAALERVENAGVLGPLECSGRTLSVVEAVDRTDAANLANSNAKRREEEKEKEKKDTRNLYLIRQGLIMNNTAAYTQLSSHDKTLRRKLEVESKAKIAIPNMSVSRTRVSVHNMPLTLTEGELRKMVTEACVYKGRLLQVKVVRSKDRIGTDAKLRSKGFGFLEFAEHEDALAVIAGMNNSPKFFDAKKRPILQFAWVDVQVIKKILRRREESKVRVQRLKGDAEEVDPKREKLLRRIERRKRKKDAARLERSQTEGGAGSGGAAPPSEAADRSPKRRKADTPPASVSPAVAAPRAATRTKSVGRQQNDKKRVTGLVTLHDRTEGAPVKSRAGKAGRQKREQATAKFDDLVDKYRAKLSGAAQKTGRWA